MGERDNKAAVGRRQQPRKAPATRSCDGR